MKRGISPLIATVLLIGTTILIAAIVSTFIINQTKKFDPEEFMGESSFCQDVVVGTKVDCGAGGCEVQTGRPENDAGFPAECRILENMYIVNKGSFTIYNLSVVIEGLGSDSVVNIEDGLAPGEPYNELTLAICEDKGVRIVPYIKVEGEEIVCTQSEMVINEDRLGIF